MPSSPTTREFAAELYLPSGDAELRSAAIRRARQVAARQRRQGVHIRYRRSVFLPADETCFLFFQADSIETVAQVGALAGLLFDRIVEATTL
jgi:hypothetical protein